MPKIDIPDNCIPEGAEIVEGRPVERSGVYWGGEDNSHMTICIPIRRKPRLKKIMFTVTGEPRWIRGGEWYLDSDNIARKCPVGTNTGYDFTPLRREEVYE